MVQIIVQKIALRSGFNKFSLKGTIQPNCHIKHNKIISRTPANRVANVQHPTRLGKEITGTLRNLHNGKIEMIHSKDHHQHHHRFEKIVITLITTIRIDRAHRTSTEWWTGTVVEVKTGLMSQVRCVTREIFPSVQRTA